QATSPAVPPLKIVTAMSVRPSRVKSKQITRSAWLGEIGTFSSETVASFRWERAIAARAAAWPQARWWASTADATRGAATMPASRVAAVAVEDARARPLSERDLVPDPLAQFVAWFEAARAA